MIGKKHRYSNLITLNLDTNKLAMHILHRRQMVRARVRKGRIEGVKTGVADWRLLIARLLVGESKRERVRA